MRALVLTSLFVGLVSATPSLAEDKVETGTIKSYECGDNCYLTIITEKAQKLSRLCVACTYVTWSKHA